MKKQSSLNSEIIVSLGILIIEMKTRKGLFCIIIYYINDKLKLKLKLIPVYCIVLVI